MAHGVEEGDAPIQGQAGFRFGPFYLGAKHMVTGFDHPFLAGVIFFLSSKRSDFTSRYLRSVTA